MKIEAGKFYKTRDGRKARVYAVACGGEYPIHGAMEYPDSGWWAFTWDVFGHNSSGEQSPNDLFSEWVDEPIPIPQKKKLFAHICRKTGKIFFFEVPCSNEINYYRISILDTEIEC